ncbi:hypothetical protein ACFQJ7_17000 [Halovenus rubra]|uniref:DUF8101 domain-containing protein n=2 Tax=Halovenus rubra TaxID=869890 RepID=A0ABD5X936_9EURY|nr:hypothetical protein [Halovenus rubra]
MNVPEDIASVLSQLCRESSAAFKRGDRETGVAAITSAATVADNKLPESDLRQQVLHGCERAETVATADESELGVAAEYAASIERHLDETHTE